MSARWSVGRTVVAGLGLLSAWPGTAAAQSYIVRNPSLPGASAPAPQTDTRNKTLLSVELLVDESGGGLQVHEWNKVFRDLGVSLRVRRGLPGEEVGVTEQSLGPLREVRVLGKLDRAGRIVLPDRTFSPSDAARLGEWFRELQAFGAQGNPEGKPLWGLSKAQFAEVYSALGRKKVAAETAGKSLTDALAALELPAAYPLQWTAEARDWQRTRPDETATVRNEVQDFSHGTALAMLLSEFGLGFYPLRTPTGAVELAVVPLEKRSDVWPVGWEAKETAYKTAPALFQLVPAELSDAPLTDLLEAVSAKTGVPVRIDHHLIEKHDIDLKTLRVSYPPRKTSWNLLLRGATNSVRLSHDLRIDELGRPFVWVSTLKVGKLGR